jgi:zinc D-Ala-D-Ala carboxypeptidase
MPNNVKNQPCEFTRARPTIKQGSTGDAVKQAQCYMNYSMDGEQLLEDGVFGPVVSDLLGQFSRVRVLTP